MTGASESIRDPSVGAGMLAFLALTKDEPVELALEYIRTAHERVGAALAACRQGPDAKSILPAAIEKELSEVNLFLVGLSMAADPQQRTSVNLVLKRPKGRPKRNVVKIQQYRSAALEVLKRKPLGYDAAVVEVAKESGLDRSEIEAWACHLERQYEQLGIKIK